MRVHYATYSTVLRILLRCVDGWVALWRPRRRRRAADRATEPCRILVCNQGHLGDAILATAVIPALRQRYPTAELGFLVHPASTVVVEGHPHVRWVHTVEHWHLNRDRRGWWHRWQQHRRTRRRAETEIRSVGYDLAIDVHPYFPNSIPLLARCAIGRTVGWDSGGFGGLLDEVVRHDGGATPMLDRHARLLRALGAEAEPADLRPDLALTDELRQRWSALATALKVPSPFVALHVGAHAPRRRWPADQWAAVASALQARGHTVVLFGHGHAEVALCAAIHRLSPRAIDLGGRVAWGELVAALAACRLLVSHDSAATHLATAFDTPRICIAAGIHDLRIWLRSTPRSIVLMNPVVCAPCGRTEGCETMACIRGVSAISVVDAVQRLCTPRQAASGEEGAP